MKIGLVFARDSFLKSREAISNEHIGLGYLANSLKRAGYDYEIIDAQFWDLSSDEVVDEILKNSFYALGFSVLYSNFVETMRIVNKVKKSNSQIMVFMGGYHVSFCATEILRDNQNVDIIIKGEGEKTVVELLKKYFDGRRLDEVDGIVFRNFEKSITETPWRKPLNDIEEYGEINRDVLEKGLEAGLTCSLNLIAGRGCLYKCSFCTGNKMFDPYGECGWRVMNPHKVVEQIAELHDKYSSYENAYEVINFCDLNFINESKEGIVWLNEFIGEMNSANLGAWFYIMTRVDSIVRNKNIVKRLRECGLVQIEMGLESGAETGLRVFNKQISTNQSVIAVNFLRSKHIDFCMSGFIIYQPYTTIEELRVNADFLDGIDYWKIDFLFTKMALYPGTKITEEMRKSKNLCDTFCHYNVYDWKFFDPNVEKMYNHLSCSLEYDVLSAISDTHTNFELFMTLTYRRIERLTKDDTLLNRVDRVENDVREQITHAKKIIYNYFCDVLNLAENGWDDEEFELCSNQFMAEYIHFNDQVMESFEKYNASLEEIIKCI